MKSSIQILNSLWLVILIVPFALCISLPYVPIPTIPTGTTTTGGSLISSINSAASTFSNAACEVNPTNLLCGTSVAVGHKIIQNFPAEATIRHCSIFIPSPHCCGQFCKPGKGGVCDGPTGACFCEPAGTPTVCQMLMKTESSETAGMNSNDLALLEICKDKCSNNPNGCKKAAATTDGIAGTVCMCYCDPPAK